MWTLNVNRYINRGLEALLRINSSIFAISGKVIVHCTSFLTVKIHRCCAIEHVCILVCSGETRGVSAFFSQIRNDAVPRGVASV